MNDDVVLTLKEKLQIAIDGYAFYGEFLGFKVYVVKCSRHGLFFDRSHSTYDGELVFACPDCLVESREEKGEIRVGKAC